MTETEEIEKIITIQAAAALTKKGRKDNIKHIKL